MVPPPVTEDYYSVLDVEYGADLATIKSSYKRLAKVRHPDKNIGDDARATASFQLVGFHPHFLEEAQSDRY